MLIVNSSNTNLSGSSSSSPSPSGGLSASSSASKSSMVGAKHEAISFPSEVAMSVTVTKRGRFNAEKDFERLY